MPSKVIIGLIRPTEVFPTKMLRMLGRCTVLADDSYMLQKKCYIVIRTLNQSLDDIE